MTGQMNAFPLRTLIFHVTASCNLMCRHCWQFSGFGETNGEHLKKSDGVPPEIFDRLVHEAKGLGLEAVKFTGGEPFLHPDFMDFLEIANINNLSVIIETNGTLLDKDHVERLKTVKQLLVSVSLDGTSSYVHDRFRGHEGAFDKTLKALDLLVGGKIPVQIIMCLHRGSVDDLDDMIRLAAEHKAASIKINPIQPLGRGDDLVKSGDSFSVSTLLEFSDYCRNHMRPQFSGEVVFALPMAFRPFSEIQNKKSSVCRIFQILGLLPDGNVSFCGIGNLDASAVFGNIHDTTLTEIWNESPLLRTFRESLPWKLEGVCSLCIFKAVCLGECRASSYHQTKNLMAPFWICQEAYESGLFPTSRLAS
jgi:SynChlorMet cassette radical SAM/SPASM protein ScmF